MLILLKDPNANSTTKIEIKPSRIFSPKTYQQRMKLKNVTDNTLITSEHPYNIEMIAGRYSVFSDESSRHLTTIFFKNIQKVPTCIQLAKTKTLYNLRMENSLLKKFKKFSRPNSPNGFQVRKK